MQIEKYRVSKWGRKQKKYNKTRLNRTQKIKKKRNDTKKNNKKALKRRTKQYCNIVLKNIKYRYDNDFDDIENSNNVITKYQCHVCLQPFLLKDLPMTYNEIKPFVCVCCTIQNKYGCNAYYYTTINKYGNCIICHENYYHQQLLVIDCKICKQSLSKYFAKNTYTICINCANHTDICTTNNKSTFCALFKRKTHSSIHDDYVPIIRPDIINEPMKWEFGSKFCGYKTTETDDWNLYSICNEKYKIIYKKNSKLCYVKGCNNKDTRKYCYHHKCCIICNYELLGKYKIHNCNYGCKKCSNIYCNTCGKEGYCSTCFRKQEKTTLLYLIKHITAGYEDLLYDDIIFVIFNYASKYALICANYDKCKNVMISETAAWQWDVYDVECYYIRDEYVDENVIYNCPYINGRYIRIFCPQCVELTHYCKICYQIEIDEYCWNHQRYKCEECDQLRFCDEKTDYLCELCGKYSCCKCSKSKHKRCVDCKCIFCNDIEYDIFGKCRCKNCEIGRNERVARISKLSATSPEFVPDQQQHNMIMNNYMNNCFGFPVNYNYNNCFAQFAVYNYNLNYYNQ